MARLVGSRKMYETSPLSKLTKQLDIVISEEWCWWLGLLPEVVRRSQQMDDVPVCRERTQHG